MANLEKIREFFNKDKYATKHSCCYIEDARKDYAECSMDITSDHLNAMGHVMGGAIYTLADFAFAVASNLDNKPTVSVSGSMAFLSAAKGTKLIARTEALHSGKSGCAYIVNIEDDLGIKVASATIYGFRLEGETAITSE